MLRNISKIIIFLFFLLNGCMGDAFDEYKKQREYAGIVPEDIIDDIPPAIEKAEALNRSEVQVLFSEPVNPKESSNPDNFKIQGVNRIEISDAWLSDDGKTVVLSVEGDEGYRMLNGKKYTLLARNIADVEGNVLSAAYTTFNGLGNVVAKLSGLPAKVTSDVNAGITVDSAGIESYQYCLDDGEWSGEMPVSEVMNFQGLSEGYHTVKVVGKDSSDGKWQEMNQPTVYTWYVDLTAPIAGLANCPSTSTSDETTSIVVTGGDVNLYMYSLNGAAWSNEIAADVPIELEGLTDGEYTLRVIGCDASGNWQDEMSASICTWTVDSASLLPVISQAPAEFTNSSNAVIGIAADEEYSLWRYRVNGGSWSSDIDAAESIRLEGLTEGEYTVQIQGRTVFGDYPEDEISAVYKWTVDFTTPQAVMTESTLPALSTSNQFINVRIDSDEDIASYRWKLDNGNWSGVLDPDSPVSVEGISEGYHTLYISAIDAAGNEQQFKGEPSSYSWRVDLTAPTAVLYDYPVSVVNTSSISVRAGGDIVAYKYRLNSGTWSSERSSSLRIETVTGQGSQTLGVIGRDAAGNWQPLDSPTQKSWEVDTVAPVIELLNTPNSPTNSSSALITVNGADTAAYKFILDPAEVPDDNDWDALTEYNAELPLSLSGIFEGIHTLYVIARDDAGNWNQAADASVCTWTVNFEAPEAELSNLPSHPSQKDFISVSVGGDDISAYMYSLDGGEWSQEYSIAEPISEAGISEGIHELRVIGRKPSGIWQDVSSSTDYTWRVDLTPPAAILYGLPLPLTTQGSIGITVDPGDAVTYKYRIDTDSWSAERPVSQAISVAGLPEGNHVIKVIAKDSAGNWQADSSATEHSWEIDLTAPEAPAVYDTGDFDSDVQLSFSWVNPADTVEARIQIATDSSFVYVVYGGTDGISVGNAEFFDYTADLADGSKYYARISVRDSAGNWSPFGTSSNGVDIAGHVSGQLKDTSGNPVTGAEVIVRETDTGDQIASGMAEATGNFTVSGVPVGTNRYQITFAASGYGSALKNNVTVDPGSVTNIGVIYLVPEGSSAGTVSGTVIDANTGSVISGASVVISDWTASEAASSTSGADGSFTLDSAGGGGLAPGTYTVTISNTGYFSLIIDNVTVNGSSNLDRLAICERLTEPQVRVVVQWKSRPSDLDLHLAGPTESLAEGRFHVYWSNKKSYNESTGVYTAGSDGDPDGSFSTSSLVLDDVDGYGPEAINIFRLGDVQYCHGIYTYTIHKYSYNNSWSDSNAVVRIFDSQGLAREISIPSDAPSAEQTNNDRYWRMFKINIQGASRSKRSITVYSDFADGGIPNCHNLSFMDW